LAIIIKQIFFSRELYFWRYLFNVQRENKAVVYLLLNTTIKDICIRSVPNFPDSLYKVVLTGQHVDVSTVRDGEDVGWHFITPLATVQFGTPKSVDRVTLVGVDGHAEETGVGLQRVSKYCYSDGDSNQ
jgi:hypothetical protein